MYHDNMPFKPHLNAEHLVFYVAETQPLTKDYTLRALPAEVHWETEWGKFVSMESYY